LLALDFCSGVTENGKGGVECGANRILRINAFAQQNSEKNSEFLAHGNGTSHGRKAFLILIP
jgi:hypothetical protein